MLVTRFASSFRRAAPKTTVYKNVLSLAAESVQERVSNVISLDFVGEYEAIFLLIGFISTALFVFETLVKIYRIFYASSSRKRRKRRGLTFGSIDSIHEEPAVVMQEIVNAIINYGTSYQ